MGGSGVAASRSSTAAPARGLVQCLLGIHGHRNADDEHAFVVAAEVAEDLTPAPSFALSPHPTTHPPHAGEVAEDLARYLADSEQAQAALGLGVAIARDQR